MNNKIYLLGPCGLIQATLFDHIYTDIFVTPPQTTIAVSSFNFVSNRWTLCWKAVFLFLQWNQLFNNVSNGWKRNWKKTRSDVCVGMSRGKKFVLCAYMLRSLCNFHCQSKYKTTWLYTTLMVVYNIEVQDIRTCILILWMCVSAWHECVYPTLTCFSIFSFKKKYPALKQGYELLVELLCNAKLIPEVTVHPSEMTLSFFQPCRFEDLRLLWPLYERSILEKWPRPTCPTTAPNSWSARSPRYGWKIPSSPKTTIRTNENPFKIGLTKAKGHPP